MPFFTIKKGVVKANINKNAIHSILFYIYPRLITKQVCREHLLFITVLMDTLFLYWDNLFNSVL